MAFKKVVISALALLLVAIIFSACASGNKNPSASPTPASVGSTATVPLVDQGLAPTNPSSTVGKTTPSSAGTDAGPLPTAGSTRVPMVTDWRDAPIMPEVSQHILEIYQEGQKQGRDPHAFSVIGDCQAVPVVFMGPYELNQLAPDPSESYLWDVIHYFKGSYARWGMAVRGGFTAASVLSPMQADPNSCKSGETPLTCEYRVHNPAFVFITLETWLDPTTVDRYDGYLRHILDYVIAHGSVPILMTKADSSEMRNGTHVFNPVIIKAAYDYDVPVINFWRAAQYLDNSGIDRKREGFHLSQAGYDLKNTLALRALYKVWTAVQTGSVTAASPVDQAPLPTSAAPAPSPTPTPQVALVVTTPQCDGGCVYYARARSLDGVVKFQGVFAYDYTSKKQTQILGEGLNLQDVSADGKRLLANDGSDLYEVNLADGSSKLVSDSFYYLGKQAAYWKSDGTSIVYLDSAHPIQAGSGAAFNLFSSSLDGSTYFESGSCSSQDFCKSIGVFRQDSGGAVSAVDQLIKPVFSPDGSWMAFLNPAAATSENYFHINYLLAEDPQKGVGTRRVFYLPDKHKWLQYPDVRLLAFSPDSKKLFIVDDIYYEYTESSLRLETYMVDLTTGILYDYGKITGAYGSFNPRMVWSPQGDKVLFFLTSQAADGTYSLGVYQTILNTDQRLVPYDPGLFTSPDYFYITNIFWR